MVQLVEVHGSGSGSGKSTLYVSLIKLISDVFDPTDDALREIVLFNDTMSHMETFAKYLFSVISTRGRNIINLKSLRFLVVAASRNNKIQMSNMRNDHFEYSLESEFEEFSRQYPAFVNYLWRGIATRKSVGGKDLRPNLIQYVKSRLARFQYLKRSAFKGIVVSDEGIMSCIGIAIDGAPGACYVDKINNVLDIVNLPSGIIYIQASAETSARRVYERDQHCMARNYPYHELIEKNHDVLKKREVLYNLIEARGQSVLRLNGEGAHDENSVQALNFMKLLLKTSGDPK